MRKQCIKELLAMVVSNCHFVDLETEWEGEPMGDWGSIQDNSAVTEWREG